MELLFLAVGVIIGGVIIGLLLISKIGKQDAKVELLNSELQKSETELKTEREKNTYSLSEISKLETINLNLQEKLNDQKKELEELQLKFTDAFKNLANEILEEKTKKFTEQNKTNLDELLNPLKEKIKDFEQKVEHTDEKNRISNASLIEQIKGLKDLNKKISDDANNLTKALKGDVKIQGNWGEEIVKRILEESGLTEGVEYVSQAKGLNLKSESGHSSRPDFIIKLPEQKHIIVDSKVSLVSYEKFMNEAENQHQKDVYLKALNNSLKSHIDDLDNKHYQNLQGLNSPDFVLLFMPIEGSFNMIVHMNSPLYQYAFDKRILLVSPSSLLATLRTIAYIWRQEKQNKNAIIIAKQAGDLYDKFVGLIKDLEDIGKSINKSKDSYDNAINKLSTGKGNLVKRTENLKILGAKAKKQIPEKFIEKEESIKGLE